jgi:predicted metal-dependent hydrolase
MIHTSKQTPHHLIEQYIQDNIESFIKKIHTYQQSTWDLWGKTYQIIEFKGVFQYQIEDEKLYITHEEQSLETAYKKVLKEELKKVVQNIEYEVNSRLKLFNIKPRNYQFKWYISKFGSYHKGHDTIALNTFLASLDVSLLKYVIYHEYAHTIHFHHQKSFYNLLENLLPGHKEYEKKLKSLVISRHYTV